MAVNDRVDVHVTKNGPLWLASLECVAGGMSARSLKELHGDIAEGLPFLFSDHDVPPVPVFHYTLPGVTEADLAAFAALQRRAAAIADAMSFLPLAVQVMATFSPTLTLDRSNLAGK